MKTVLTVVAMVLAAMLASIGTSTYLRKLDQSQRDTATQEAIDAGCRVRALEISSDRAVKRTVLECPGGLVVEVK